MREIKEFLDSMDGRLNSNQEDYDDTDIANASFNGGWLECVKAIIGSSEYKRLKDKLAEMEESGKRMANFEIGRSYELPDKPQCPCRNRKGGSLIEVDNMISQRCVKCGEKLNSPDKKYYGHIDPEGKYTFPHEEQQKKQTLLEYTLERYGSPKGNVTNMNADCIIKLISEYLEKKD